eukprot:4066050-Pyramimonas_sp.AAC.1
MAEIGVDKFTGAYGKLGSHMTGRTFVKGDYMDDDAPLSAIIEKIDRSSRNRGSTNPTAAGSGLQ